MKSIMKTQRNSVRLISAMALTLALGSIIARENIPSSLEGGGKVKAVSNPDKVMGDCSAGQAQTEMKLNNVRTRILTSGDMWWDLSNAKYEVPKGSNSHAVFAGSLWFGGYQGGSLKVSAMTYRQTGIDFWPGPLDANDDIVSATCNEYDKHWRFNRADVDQFYADNTVVAAWLKDYPGTSPTWGLDGIYHLAPFHDADGDNLYNWAAGDYPRYNVSGANVAQGDCKRRLFGDETLFWVFNDKGNIHSETTGGQIGVEIRAQGFQFATSDELNDMTFYNFEIINRSSNKLDSTYFAVWVDADLGAYDDDYVGCDVKRGLGYIYNGDNYDDDQNGQTGYRDKLPALGCDFFQGPIADAGDGIDNDRDGCIDCTFYIDPATGLPTSTVIPESVLPEQISMSRYHVYNNTGNSQNGNPSSNGGGIQFYNYMNGRWRDGSPVTYGGTGISATGTPCNFMYPDNTDPAFTTPWNEVIAGNLPGDRRFMQCAGKFTLQPGAVNYITFGLPFVRTNTNNNFAAIPLLQRADDKAQALFDNCFKVLDGPDAPDITIQELDQQLVLALSNKPSSNNYEAKRYKEVDVTIPATNAFDTTWIYDRQYKFEGYIIYQLKDETVSQTDLHNPSLARAIFQCDLENGVSKIINYVDDQVLGAVPSLMVDGADKGISNSFLVTDDQFAEGSKKLVNFKTYYFMAVAYAYNNYLTYKPDVAPSAIYDTATGQIKFTDPPTGSLNGQKKPFLRGRRNIKVYSGIPHNPMPEAFGTVQTSGYGNGPKVTRLEGQGNGGNALDFTAASEDSIVRFFKMRQPTYENGRGPLKIKVVDPLRIVKGDFEFTMRRLKDSAVASPVTNLILGSVEADSIIWKMTGTYTDLQGQTKSKTWYANMAIAVGNEQLIFGTNNEFLGFSVIVQQAEDPAAILPPASGPRPVLAKTLLESSMSFADGSNKWLSGVADIDGTTLMNWIRAGKDDLPATGGNTFDDKGVAGSKGTAYIDDDQLFEKIVDRTWAPYRVVATNKDLPNGLIGAFGYEDASAPLCVVQNNSDLRTLASVDVVFTSDKSKWTRCPVLDLSAGRYYRLRRMPSIDKNGNYADTITNTVGSNNENDAHFISPIGMSWFPGYAINLETGERLNLMFGENSADTANYGHNMKWDPTSKVRESVGGTLNYYFGGKHAIYVLGHNSDTTFAPGSSGITNMPCDIPNYDYGKAAIKLLRYADSLWGNPTNPVKTRARNALGAVMQDAMYVNVPIIRGGYNIYDANRMPTGIPTVARVKIRVSKPYRYALGGHYSNVFSNSTSILTTLGTLNNSRFPATNNPAHVPDDLIPGAINGNFPRYKFSTYDLAAEINNSNAAKDALAKINVVPNPYYAHSAYEKTRIDNVIKIINLPVKCKIRIYTLAGTLIRTINKDNDQTYVNWDLKNDKNIGIASGLYIIHIDVPDVGERILKWFGVMRPFDLQSY